jgi:hypothetical protein
MLSDENKQAATLAEYNTLRQEILGYQRDSMSILAFSGVLAAVTLGYAIKERAELLFFVVILILIAPLLLQVQRLRATYRIGRYIQVFLEGQETGLAYETRWTSFKVKVPLHEKLYSFKFAVTLPVMILQAASLALMLYFCKTFCMLTGVLCAIGAVVLCYEAWLVWHADRFDDLLDTMNKVKAEEKP